MAEQHPNTIVFKVVGGLAVAAAMLLGSQSDKKQDVKPPLGVGEVRGFRASAPVVRANFSRGWGNHRFDDKPVAIYFDSTGPYGYLGDLYSRQIEQLLTHFDVRAERIAVESYNSGDLNKASANLYLGTLYDNPLPTAFKTDVLTTKQPICWMGYNLWQVAWNSDKTENKAFSNATGFRFLGIDSLGYPTVSYKGVDLIHEQFDKNLGKVEILDPSKATAVAVSKRDDGLTMPYITRSGSLFYVADNPLSYVSWKKNCDKALAFYDVMHDVLGSKAPVDHRAVLRIEDVSPNVPPENLTALADVLQAENVPYVVSVIPSYRNYQSGVSGGTRIDMQDKPDFLRALRYMDRRGGQILMHGWTHQYSTIANPYNSESATDYEFFRVKLADSGVEVPLGPVPEDSAKWAGDRLDQGLKSMRLSGWWPTGWVTPHYLATQADYGEIAKRFDYAICRSLTYATGDDGTQYFIQLLSPWVTRDAFGIKHIPETIGYVDPTGYAGIPPRLPADVVGYAHAQKVVRDGWAGCYFHWFLDPSMLRDLVRGVKAEGFRFVNPSGSTK